MGSLHMTRMTITGFPVIHHSSRSEIENFDWPCYSPISRALVPRSFRVQSSIGVMPSKTRFLRLFFLPYQHPFEWHAFANENSPNSASSTDWFLEWAAQYDEGRLEGRSRAIHEHWLSQRTCQILRIDGDLSVDERLERCVTAMPSLAVK
jgi:hypothetical protein